MGVYVNNNNERIFYEFYLDNESMFYEFYVNNK